MKSLRMFVVELTACITIGLMVANTLSAQGNLRSRKIVVFRDGFADEAAQAALARACAAEPLQPLRLINGMAVLLTPRAERSLRNRAEVLRIEPDAAVEAIGSPPWSHSPSNLQQPSQQIPWGINRIDAEWAWGASRGAGVKVAVLDTGIAPRHPDLMDNIAGGVNFVRIPPQKKANPRKWSDDNGHGTHVAGIIAAANNTIGVVGVAPQARLYAVKVLGASGSGHVSAVIAGIQWCIDNGIQIANLSLRADQDVLALHEACDRAAAAGLLLVAAAGNNGTHVDYPAAYDSVIAVSATDINDMTPSWSSLGPEVDVAAPGVDVLSTWNDGGYALASGTSTAAPHVTGVLALMLALPHPILEPLDILHATADDLPPVGCDVWTGWGLVDAEQCVTGAQTGDDLP